MSVTWNIEKLVITDSDARAHWRAVAEDGNTITDVNGNEFPNILSSCGEWSIDSSEITQTSTEDDVILALHIALGDDQVAKIENSLEAQLAKRIAPAGVTYSFENGVAKVLA